MAQHGLGSEECYKVAAAAGAKLRSSPSVAVCLPGPSPQVCFSLQSAAAWDLFLFRLGSKGPGFALGGHTWGPDGEQQITGWVPGGEERGHYVNVG